MVPAPVTSTVTVIALQSGFGFLASIEIALTSRSAFDPGTVFVAASAEISTRPTEAPISAIWTNLPILIVTPSRKAPARLVTLGGLPARDERGFGRLRGLRLVSSRRRRRSGGGGRCTGAGFVR